MTNIKFGVLPVLVLRRWLGCVVRRALRRFASLAPPGDAARPAPPRDDDW